MKSDLEHREQVAFFNWCKWQKHEAFKTIFAIPNGGHRHIHVAKKLKDEGVVSGVPDVFLAYPKREPFGIKYSGLFIEFKRPKIGKLQAGRLTKEQKLFKNHLENAGYMHIICYNSNEAIVKVNEYLGVYK